MRLGLFVIVLALNPIVLNAQTSPEWSRVYSFDESIVDMNTLLLTRISADITRVRFRWTFNEPQPLSGTPNLKYQSELEVFEFNCSSKLYRPFHFTFFDAEGNTVRIVDSPGEWQKVQYGSMTEKLFVPACDLIRNKTQPPATTEADARLEKVAQFALDVAQYQQKEKDFKALTDRFFVSNYLDRYLHDQRTNWFVNLNRDTAARLSRQELQQFYVALMNAGYLSSLYLISQIPIDAEEDPGPAEKLLPPDVLQLVRTHPYTARYKTIEGDPDLFGENLDSVERVRTYTDLLEKINSLLREHVKTVKASDSKEWKEMMKNWNLFEPKARVCSLHCLGLPAGTTLFEVNIPVFTLQVAEVDGKLKVISAKSGF